MRPHLRTMVKIELFQRILGYVLLIVISSFAPVLLLLGKAPSPVLLPAFIMVAFIAMTDPWQRVDEWKLHLPIATRGHLIERLISDSLRIGIAAAVCACFVSWQGNFSLPVLFSLLASEFFFALSFLLLMRLPSPTLKMWPYAAVLIPLAIGFAALISQAELPVWVSPTMAAAIFAALVYIAFSRLPVSFLLAGDNASPKPTPKAPAAVSTPSRWRSLLLINADTSNVLYFVPLTCFLAFVELGVNAQTSAMLAIVLVFPPKDSAHLPVSLRLRFAFLLIPALLVVLIGSLGAHYVKGSPLAFYPGYHSSYRFGHAPTNDANAMIYEAHLWPLSASIVPCPGPFASEFKDMQYLRAGLHRCYGFDPNIDLAPYMKDGLINWESFWDAHPSTPKDLNYRLAVAVYYLIILFLSAFAVLAARIAARSGPRTLRKICRYPMWAVWVPVLIPMPIPIIWYTLGGLHAEMASSGAIRLESAFVGVIAEPLPITPAITLLVLVALAAPLYIAAQELFTRCGQA